MIIVLILSLLKIGKRNVIVVLEFLVSEKSGSEVRVYGDIVKVGFIIGL